MFERIVAAIDSDAARSAGVVEAAREIAMALQSSVLVVNQHAVDGSLVEDAVTTLRAAGVRASGSVEEPDGRDLLEVASGFGATVVIACGRGALAAGVPQDGGSHTIIDGAPCPVLLVH